MGNLINLCKYLITGCKEDRASLFSMVPNDKKIQWAQTEFPVKLMKKLFLL